MSRERTSSEKLAQYIDQYCDESLSSNELAELEELLSRNDAALEQFLLRMEIHSALAWPRRNVQHANLPSSNQDQELPKSPVVAPVAPEDSLAGLLFPPAESPLSSQVHPKGGSIFGSFMSLFQPPMVFVTSLLLVLGSVWATYQVMRSAADNPADSVAARQVKQATPVAYLTSVNGCDWGNSPLKTGSAGDGIDSGSIIALHEGIAEFRLASDIHLTVEGPVALVIASPKSLLLQHGKLTARVPWKVKDFQLWAGACRMTACDAEFGVDVSSGQVEVHSFAGETLLLPSPIAGSFTMPTGMTSDTEDGDPEDSVESLKPIVIEEGQAVVLPAAGNASLSQVAADRSKFAAKLSMGGRLPVTAQYVDAVKAANPAGYWRFEAIEDSQVRNEIRDGESLKVVGEVVLTGDAQNRSLEIGSTAGGGHLVSDLPVPLSGTDYTVEIWCKPSHFHRGTLVAMGQEKERRPRVKTLIYGFMLQLLRNDDNIENLPNSIPGSLRFLHRSPPTRDPKTGTACYSKELYQLRRWQHVAAVKNQASMRLYVDGTLAAEASDSTDIPSDMRLMVGEVYFRRSDLQDARTFFGQLDELAIYNRALTEDEIKKHLEAIDFKPPTMSPLGSPMPGSSEVH